MELKSYLQRNNFFLVSFIIFLSIITTIRSATCKDNKAINNKDCFNDVLIFDSMNWRAGHSAVNQNGDFILEFSRDQESGARLFYGLKSNGRYYFLNESSTKEVLLQEKNGVIARYESINSFVSLKNDINKTKEYFLSLSTFKCFLEIYDFNEEGVELDTIYNSDYLDRQIFSFKFEIFETNYTGVMTYYLVFGHRDGNEEYAQLSVKKITFSSLNFNKNDIVASKTLQGKLNDRTVTAFLVDDVNDDDFRIIVTIYVKHPKTNESPRYNFTVFCIN